MGAGGLCSVLCQKSCRAVHLLWTPAPLHLALACFNWHHQASNPKGRAVHHLNFFMAQRGWLCGWIWWSCAINRAMAEWERAVEGITHWAFPVLGVCLGRASSWSIWQEEDWSKLSLGWGCGPVLLQQGANSLSALQLYGHLLCGQLQNKLLPPTSLMMHIPDI